MIDGTLGNTESFADYAVNKSPGHKSADLFFPLGERAVVFILVFDVSGTDASHSLFFQCTRECRQERFRNHRFLMKVTGTVPHRLNCDIDIGVPG